MTAPGWFEAHPCAAPEPVADGVCTRVPSATWRGRMDGNCARTFDLRLAARDTVVFLDVPRVTCVWRLFRRRFENIWRPRAELPPGCPDCLTWEFLAWVWTYPTRRRPAILERLSAPGRPFVSYVLHRRPEVAAFVAGLDRGASADMTATSSARLAPDGTPRGHDDAL